MSFKKPLLAALALTGMLATAACGGGDSGDDGTGGAGDKSEYNVAIIRWDPNDEFFNGVQAGEDEEYQRLAKELGITINTNVFGANDEAEQVEALRAQMAKGIDGVSLVSWRGEAMKGILGELRDEGIPIVTHNSYVPDVEQTYVSFDGVLAGEKAAQAIVDTLDANRGEAWRQSDGVFVELRCLITLSTDVDRHDGMHSVIDPIMEANPKIEIVTQEAECDGEKARKITDDAISKYGIDKVLGVMAIDGTAAIGGAIPALKAAGGLYPNTDPKYIPVASVDCSKAELDSIAAGEETECSEQPAKGEGIVAAHLLVDMMVNQKLEPTLSPADVQAKLAEAYGEQPWMPVAEVPASGFTGTWYGIKSFAVPGDLAVDAPGHWAQ